MMWPEVVEATATAVGSVGVVGALIYTARQTHALSNQARLQSHEAERNIELQQANLELRLMELTISIDRIFLDRPALRPYFYENRPLSFSASRRRRAEVISVAELLIDFVDAIACLRRHGQMADRDYENWLAFTESYYHQSPAIRQLWGRWGEFYLPETAELFQGRNGPTELHVDDRAHGVVYQAFSKLTKGLQPRFPQFESPGQE